MIRRIIKGSEKSLDIRPYIVSITPVNGSLMLETETIGGRTVRVDEVLGQLIDDPLQIKSLSVCRKKQLIRSGSNIHTPMEF